MLRTLLIFIASIAALGAATPKPANDAVIESTIRAKFAKSKINEEHFKVTVRSGVALLEGRTSVPQRKGAATRMAKSGGARQVVNKIEVSEAARRQMVDRLQKARERKPAAAPSSPQPAPVAPSTPQPAPLRRMQIKP